MTTTYDPHHPDYLDEADVRGELSRVFDVCGGCRRCVDLCSSFPTLFEMLDEHEEVDAGRLTPAQQEEVVDACTVTGAHEFIERGGHAGKVVLTVE